MSICMPSSFPVPSGSSVRTSTNWIDEESLKICSGYLLDGIDDVFIDGRNVLK